MESILRGEEVLMENLSRNVPNVRSILAQNIWYSSPISDLSHSSKKTIPNTRPWLYLANLSVFQTQTRSLCPISDQSYPLEGQYLTEEYFPYKWKIMRYKHKKDKHFEC